MNNNRLLIIGTTPPPLGGVTVHVNRLIFSLEKSGINYQFYNLKYFNIFSFIKELYYSNVAHLHSSNRLLILIFVLLGKLLRTKTIFTIHGNLRMNEFLFFFEKLSIKLATVPILLNQQSYNKANLLNERSTIISSFIPPRDEDMCLPKALLDLIEKLRSETNFLFCTNASDLAYDHLHHEIYGIKNLIELFRKHNELGLIISDPSGKNYLKLKDRITSNILFINQEHTFPGVLIQADAFIRATTSDGDSLSIKEAIYLGKLVIASDCVSRPHEVIKYTTNNWQDLEKLVLENSKKKSKVISDKNFNAFIHLRDLYIRLL